MKALLLVLCALLAPLSYSATAPAAAPAPAPANLVAVAPVSVFLGTDATPAIYITGASRTVVTAPLIYGGNGTIADPAWAGKIVLVDRGIITFLAKINAVKAAGGVGMVLLGDDGPFTGNLGAASTITAVTVTDVDGRKLSSAVGARASIGQVPPPDPPAPAFALPAPTDNNKGHLLMSDGKAYVLIPVMPQGALISTTSDVYVGADVTLSASSSGSEPFTFKWTLNGADLQNGDRQVYTMANVQESQAGTYICAVSNVMGTATSNAFVLKVKAAANTEHYPGYVPPAAAAAGKAAPKTPAVEPAVADANAKRDAAHAKDVKDAKAGKAITK